MDMTHSIGRVGFSDQQESFQAGYEAARQASTRGQDVPDWHLAILISTSRHDPALLRDGVRAVVGAACTVVGGYGVGVITNTDLAYDGFQVGVLLVSFSSPSKFDVLLARGLADNETEVGRQLGAAIRDGGYEEDPSVILLYDSVNRLKGSFQMNMATYLLAGIYRELASWPRLVGAGLVGDMQCRETYQWHGDEVLQQSAMALVFSGALRIDSTVMHGCRPASSYHRITKTEGNVVLEIDGVPALDKIADLLGRESGKTWKDYSFFVTFGVNRGEKFGPFDEDRYANRLCMGVDEKRKGLVMFEPDLMPGSEIQLMRRDLDFGYIGEKVAHLLAGLGGRKPIFAFYIDCAGRAASYSGFDKEEAVEVQKALGEIPLLGFYSGVEIGEIAGVPTPLDWTGVLAIVSEAVVEEAPPQVDAVATAARTEEVRASAAVADIPGDASEGQLRALVANAQTQVGELSKAVDYYAALTDELAGLNVRHDSNITVLNNELRLKRQGFAVLANLQAKIHTRQTFEDLCLSTIHEINATLNMDRTVVLVREGDQYRAVFWNGFVLDEHDILRGASIEHDPAWMEEGHLLANRRGGKAAMALAIKERIPIPFFVGVPIREGDPTIGLLLSGRLKEAKPFFPPLESGDIDTFLAISGFLSATHQLNRQRENLEELNRTLEQKVRERTADLREALDQLEVKNRFIKRIFGRYMSNEVVEQILEAPEGLDLGGKTLSVSVMFTDLRGFSAISEALSAETVVEMLNLYLKEMTEVIFKYSGTINEFMGDGILILFGAPTMRQDDADRAVACALEMQLAMSRVNALNRERGYPELSMGIGIHTGNVVAGNIGSDMRTKYAVVGRNVNLTARVESYTVGGQVLVTQATRDAVSSQLEAAASFSAPFKGIAEPVTMYEISGISGAFNVRLPPRKVVFKSLISPLAIRYEPLSGKTSAGEFLPGNLCALAAKDCVLELPSAFEVRANIKFFLESNPSPDEAVYAKVMRLGEDGRIEVNLTHIPQAIQKVFAALLE